MGFDYWFTCWRLACNTNVLDWLGTNLIIYFCLNFPCAPPKRSIPYNEGGSYAKVSRSSQLCR